jgi:hypothetical protein
MRSLPHFHVGPLLTQVAVRSRNVERQAEAIGLGADEVLRITGSAEKIAAAVERLIGR